MKKDYCPGYFDLSTGGVVGEGEDDDLSAQREVAEELGIANAVLEKVKVVKFDGENSRVFGNVYVLRGFDPDAVTLTLQADEVDEVVYWSKEQINDLIENSRNEGSSDVKITPDSIGVYQDLLQNGVL